MWSETLSLSLCSFKANDNQSLAKSISFAAGYSIEMRLMISVKFFPFTAQIIPKDSLIKKSFLFNHVLRQFFLFYRFSFSLLDAWKQVSPRSGFVRKIYS